VIAMLLQALAMIQSATFTPSRCPAGMPCEVNASHTRALWMSASASENERGTMMVPRRVSESIV
jgi:hypothetical protein